MPASGESRSEDEPSQSDGSSMTSLEPESAPEDEDEDTTAVIPRVPWNMPHAAVFNLWPNYALSALSIHRHDILYKEWATQWLFEQIMINAFKDTGHVAVLWHEQSSKQMVLVRADECYSRTQVRDWVMSWLIQDEYHWIITNVNCMRITTWNPHYGHSESALELNRFWMEWSIHPNFNAPMTTRLFHAHNPDINITWEETGEPQDL